MDGKKEVLLMMLVYATSNHEVINGNSCNKYNIEYWVYMLLENL